MPNATTDQAMQVALGHHQAGRFAQAHEIYRQLLTQDPTHADALHLLGILFIQAGRLDEGIELVKRAIARNPLIASYHNSLGNGLGLKKLHEEAIACYRLAVRLSPDYVDGQNNLGIALSDIGRYEEAAIAFRQTIRLKPDHADAHNSLGNALRNQGLVQESIGAYRQAIACRGDFVQAYSNLGSALFDVGQIDQAIACLEHAIRIKPDFAVAHGNLGKGLCDIGRLDESIDALRRALGLQQNYPDAWNNLAAALHRKGQLEDAIDAARQALKYRPDYADALVNLGNSLRSMGQLDEAISACREAMRLQPNYPPAQVNLANALSDQGQLQEAIDLHQHAIAIDPNSAKAHFNLGLILLLLEDLPAGWVEYEWRKQLPDMCRSDRKLPGPQWDGRNLHGQTIFLHAEQGFGDAIQFVRYAPMVAERGGKVILECSAGLLRLFAEFPGVDRFVRAGDPLPLFDAHCSLLSLPLAFGTTMQTIPASVRYLKADAQLSQGWAQRMNGSDKMKVGIVWAGNAEHKNDRHRSIPLSLLAPLIDMADIDFYSLQKSGSSEYLRTGVGKQLIDYTADLTDFADTAALIANLELVISVDTAVAHLAGAMGKPVWLLLPFARDWRWLLNREDSPWYPTMRLFRQDAFGDWPGVIDRVAKCLASV